MSADAANDVPLVGSVLHPTDFSEGSHAAFAHALAIALLRQTKFTILHIGLEKERDVKWSQFPPVRKTLERWGLLEADSPESAVYRDLNVRVTKAAIHGRWPVRETAKFLEKEPYDLLVLSTDGREGLSRFLNPCDAEAMARRTETMTLFVPSDANRGLVNLEDGETSLSNILVPIAHEPDCSMAVEFARRSASILGEGNVNITLLHVGDGEPPKLDLADGPDWTFRTEQRQGELVPEIV
jgi:nucleotide-binding universal stress UspA family protein